MVSPCDHHWHKLSANYRHHTCGESYATSRAWQCCNCEATRDITMPPPPSSTPPREVREGGYPPPGIDKVRELARLWGRKLWGHK